MTNQRKSLCGSALVNKFCHHPLMFLAATIIMLPITTVLLMINVAIGIITRSAPQLNLFSFGFPISLLAVFLLMFFSAGAFGTSSQSLVDSALTSLQDLIGGLAGG